eukprot:CAMPEP_0170312744 /NCGR_PEP_ID=MMETSP0116_2-20130129/56913_1 /TAXON_ID=400756 /ORGANISM="Durinskia baltica, Strain CSIRO CS-38" /LENGTH=75 /DNA_ID=CAMNT_0010565129 /DNA_START=141 /DNA_END=365 /DNA_ORIENTATION=-
MAPPSPTPLGHKPPTRIQREARRRQCDAVAHQAPWRPGGRVRSAPAATQRNRWQHEGTQDREPCPRIASAAALQK